MTDDAPVLEPVGYEHIFSLEKSMAGYHRELRSNRAAASYLRNRGFDLEDIESFKLGLVGSPAPGHHRFRGMLVIPYLGKDDVPLTFRFRCLEQHEHRDFHHGKYNSLSGDPTRMFNVRQIHLAEEEVHVTEGELDCMILNKIGLPAVAIPGARAFKARHRVMLAGFSRIYVWGDPDEAGSEFVMKVTNALRAAVPVNLRGGDVNEVFVKDGADALLGLVKR